jgi:uncharacterized protein (DUF488 family)
VGQTVSTVTTQHARPRARHSPRSTKVFTIGYEGRDVAELVTLLTDHAIEILVDVRLTPISRRRGFSKTALSQTLAGAGITYLHERVLGNPRDNRPDYRAGLTAARRRYLKHLNGDGAEAVSRLVSLAKASSTALLCVERESSTCHRTAIADSLGMRVVSL